MSLPDHICRDVSAVIRQRLGLELMGAREADLDHSMGRIQGAFPDTPPEVLARHLAVLDVRRPEWARLVDLLTVGETYFFRDASWFAAIEEHVLLPLIAQRRREADLRLRIWSAGCATGEEPYSLAMLLDRLLPDRRAWSIEIVATDVSVSAIESARRGLYRSWSFRQVPTDIIDRHFTPRDDALHELAPAIRDMVDFRLRNLVGDIPAADDCSAMDVIVCRNVIMYFSADAQRRVAGRLASSLAADGWLLTSSAEAWAELFHPLAAVHLPGLTAFRQKAAAADDRRSVEIASPRPLRSHRASLTVAEGGREAPPAPRDLESGSSESDPIARARALADRGDYAGALALCEQGQARASLDYDSHFLHAQVCQELGDRGGARKALRRALYLRADSVHAHFLLGNLHEADGERDAARRCMRNVVDLAEAGTGTADPGEVRRLLEAARSFLETKLARGRGRHGIGSAA
jgi:chemotaxis protein methyltransferase CheR